MVIQETRLLYTTKVLMRSKTKSLNNLSTSTKQIQTGHPIFNESVEEQCGL